MPKKPYSVGKERAMDFEKRDRENAREEITFYIFIFLIVAGWVLSFYFGSGG